MAWESDVVFVEALVRLCSVLFMMSANLLLDDQETRAILDRINSYAANKVSSNYTASLYEDVLEGEAFFSLSQYLGVANDLVLVPLPCKSFDPSLLPPFSSGLA